MSWEEAIRTYGISRASISRILAKEKRKQADEPEPDHHSKRGRKSVITGDLLVFLLNELEEDSQITLEELRKKTVDKFQVNLLVHCTLITSG